MPSAKQQPSNVKHGGAIRPNVWVLTFQLLVHPVYKYIPTNMQPTKTNGALSGVFPLRELSPMV